jgi:hypothetical protein
LVRAGTAVWQLVQLPPVEKESSCATFETVGSAADGHGEAEPR